MNIKGVTEHDYKEAHNVKNTSRIGNLGDSWTISSKCTQLLADIFENSRYLKIYDLDSAYFYSAQWLAWVTALKITKFSYNY